MIPELRALMDGGDAWRPAIFPASDPGTPDALRALVASGEVAVVADTLEEQLAELMETRDPTVDLDARELRRRVDEHLHGVPLDRHGVWVHYPWSKRLVRALPEAEHHFVRASRNRNKITAAEAETLARAAIGVVGLSVGQATAITLAMEGIGGELRLADHDRLSLSNLNRLRAGVHELGVNKCVLAARAIFELDPWARVRIFPAGLGEDNLDEFLGGLQLVVEECDDLYVKVRVRERARALGIPVLMETSDRGLLDVERFDEEPDRPILHGLVGDIPSARLRGLDTQDKVPIVLRILGEAAISPRLAASLVEIKQTLKTWPQLASSVALGGAVCTDTARRVLLGQLHGSGRWYIDLDELVRERPATPSLPGLSVDAPAPPAPDGQPVREPWVRALVELASLAPSGGNCQPWRFTWDGARLRLHHDVERSRSLLDFEHGASYLALGAAAENLTLAAAGQGLVAELAPFPAPGDPSIACDATFAPAPTISSADERLLRQVPLRVTNRRLSPRARLEAEDAEALREQAARRGARLQLVTDAPALEALGRILGRGDRVRFLSKTMHGEMMRELRWTPAETERTRDGIDVATLELSDADAAGMRVTSTWPVMKLVGMVGGGTALEKPSRKAVAAAAAVGLITVPGTTPDQLFAGGRAVQRVWLEAGAREWAFQPMTALVYLFARLERGSGDGLSPRERDELATLLRAWREHFDVPSGHSEVMAFRLSRAAPPSARALRRPVDEILLVDHGPQVWAR